MSDLTERKNYPKPMKSQDSPENSSEECLENEFDVGQKESKAERKYEIRLLGPPEPFIPPEVHYSKWMDTPTRDTRNMPQSIPEFGFGYGSMYGSMYGSNCKEDLIFADEDSNKENLPKDLHKVLKEKKSGDKLSIRILGPMEPFIPPETHFSKWMDTPKRAFTESVSQDFGFGYGSMCGNDNDMITTTDDIGSKKIKRGLSQEKCRSHSPDKGIISLGNGEAKFQKSTDTHDYGNVTDIITDKSTNIHNLNDDVVELVVGTDTTELAFKENEEDKRIVAGSSAQELSCQNRKERFKNCKRKSDEHQKTENVKNLSHFSRESRKGNPNKRPKFTVRILTPLMPIPFFPPFFFKRPKSRYKRKKAKLMPKKIPLEPQTPCAPETPFDPYDPYNTSSYLMRTETHPIEKGDSTGSDGGDEIFGYGSMDFEPPCELFFGEFMDSPPLVAEEYERSPSRLSLLGDGERESTLPDSVKTSSVVDDMVYDCSLDHICGKYQATVNDITSDENMPQNITAFNTSEITSPIPGRLFAKCIEASISISNTDTENISDIDDNIPDITNSVTHHISKQSSTNIAAIHDSSPIRDPSNVTSNGDAKVASNITFPNVSRNSNNSVNISSSIASIIPTVDGD